MSDTRSPSIIPDTHRDLLDVVVVAHLATVDRHGNPQVNPVWFGWDGERVAFSMTKGRQKYRNIVRTGHAAVCITDPNDMMRYLELRGPVSIEDDFDRAQLDVIAERYLKIPRYPWALPGDERVIGRLAPERVTSNFVPKEYRVGIPGLEQ